MIRHRHRADLILQDLKRNAENEVHACAGITFALDVFDATGVRRRGVTVCVASYLMLLIMC